jgi:hypothetical protein
MSKSNVLFILIFLRFFENKFKRQNVSLSATALLKSALSSLKKGGQPS